MAEPPAPGPPPSLKYERSLLALGHEVIAGVDEVGRGSLAGPVVAAAVILPLDRPRRTRRRLSDVRDSKQLTPEQRSRLLPKILEISLSVGIGWSSHHVIDSIGIVPANQRAMQRAISALRLQPDQLLIDFFDLPASPLPQTRIVRGDALSLSIAAASVVAKVVRDRWMEKCERRFPGYCFAEHKGYGTGKHRKILDSLGPSPIHRLTFHPLASCPLS